jgi:dihydroorotate dehydrogenase electron transfer subunit
MQLEEAKIVQHTEVQGGYRLLAVEAPGIAPQVKPGQFVHLKVPHLGEALLRRPFSIFKAGEGRLSILYKSIGQGTNTMKYLQPGETLDLIGPLGNGFPKLSNGSFPVLVAGGYGMAALYLVAKTAPARGIAFFGGRSAADILCVDDFEALGWEVRITTQDGTRGQKGLVTVALDEWIQQKPASVAPEFFACGPNGMLKAVADRAIAGGWKAWISMDRNMGCGVGACLTCVQKIRTPDGGWTWHRVCREGPVFESRDVVWEE